MYVNGALVCSIRGQNTATYGGVNQVRFGLPELYRAGVSRVYGDCFELSDSHVGIETASSPPPSSAARTSNTYHYTGNTYTLLSAVAPAYSPTSAQSILPHPEEG